MNACCMSSTAFSTLHTHFSQSSQLYSLLSLWHSRETWYSWGYSPKVTYSKGWYLSLNPGSWPQGSLMEPPILHQTHDVSYLRSVYCEKSWAWSNLLFLLKWRHRTTFSYFCRQYTWRGHFTTVNLKVENPAIDKIASYQTNSSRKVSTMLFESHEFHLSIQSPDPVGRERQIQNYKLD